MVREQEERPPLERGVLEHSRQRAELGRAEASDDVVAPALHPGAVQAHQRVPVSHQLHEGVAALVGELGEIAGQEVGEDQLEGEGPRVGVAVVVARNDDQQTRGDERLEQRAGVLQLGGVTEGGQVAGEQDPIGASARTWSTSRAMRCSTPVKRRSRPSAWSSKRPGAPRHPELQKGRFRQSIWWWRSLR